MSQSLLGDRPPQTANPVPMCLVTRATMLPRDPAHIVTSVPMGPVTCVMVMTRDPVVEYIVHPRTMGPVLQTRSVTLTSTGLQVVLSTRSLCPPVILRV